MQSDFMPLFFSAPSRSGSSLLLTGLNCLDRIYVVNEPAHSWLIWEPATISGVFDSIVEELRQGSVHQRLSRQQAYCTDTFPAGSTTWTRVQRQFATGMVVGIKKSFPA